LLENVPRVLPANTVARLEKARWPRPAIFDWLQANGGVPEAEMHRTFNCGIGMVLVVPKPQAAGTVALLAENGIPAWEIGAITAREGSSPQTIVV
jgi:phosphoribosylformylglycinamidine cyclo-ligase